VHRRRHGRGRYFREPQLGGECDPQISQISQIKQKKST
jgi:hypothetical protein